ncbi:MAG: uncharacterized protein FD123_532 [Bacteroidetes bacterium]|nr:MAG: uncharacterized protein FD123_532 [Bacteroidota bacterium]
MKSRLLLLFLPAVLAGPLLAQQPDKTTSPYFYIGDSAASLPLLHTGAEVSVAGMVADVQVKQVYVNRGAKPIEAIYVFPGSTRAAVYGMKMQVGKKTLVAKIKEKEEARADYNLAKAEGKTASLLEQHRPNIFQVNVANILPGDSITVELSYTETIVPEEGVYEFVYPTVVGPRYNSPADLDPVAQVSPGGYKPANVINVPTQHEKETPLYTFGINLKISAGVPVSDISSPSHKIQLSFEEEDMATVLLDPEEKKGGNRDFVLRYRLAGNTIRNGLVTYKENGENFFLFTMQPPKRVAPDSIPGREYIFVMDVSGSMYGYPLETSKQLLRDLVGNLRESDRFNLVLFAGYANILSEKSLPATKANIDSAIALIGRQNGSGGTELKNAMDRAMALPRRENYARSIVICTDGFIGNEASVYKSIRENVGNTSVFAFGIGSSVNRFLLEGLAHCGSGEPFIVLNTNEAPKVAEKFRKYISSPVLTKVQVDFGDMQVYDTEPSAVPDLFAEKPIVIIGKYKGSTQGAITVSGMNGNRPYNSTVDIGKVKTRNSNRALRSLWARERIRLLSDYNEYGFDSARVKEITRLGLNYNLLTKYTSFIAVYDRVRNKTQEDTTMVIPVPLPQGVSDKAVSHYGYSHMSSKSVSSVTITTGGVPASYGNVTGGVVNVQACQLVEVVNYKQPLIDISSHGRMLQVQNTYGQVQTDYHYLYNPGNTNQGEQRILPFDNGPSVSGNALGAVIPLRWINTLSYGFVTASIVNGPEQSPEWQESKLSRMYGNSAEISAGGNHFGRVNGDVRIGHKFGQQVETSFSAYGDRMSGFADNNHDGFADLPAGNTGLILNRWYYKGKQFDLRDSSIRFSHQTSALAAGISRTGGQRGFTPEMIPDSSSLYGMHNRTRMIGAAHETYMHFPGGSLLSMSINGTASEVQALAGLQQYAAQEQRLRSNLVYEHKFIHKMFFKAGASFSAASLEEQLNDSTGTRREYMPGVFAEAKFMNFTRFEITAGARADYHNLFGWLFTPVSKLKISLSEDLKIFAQAGGNNRVTNTLADNLHLLQSASVISVTGNLVPEQSYTYGGGINYSLHRDKLIMSANAGFYRSEYLHMVVIDRDSEQGRTSFYNLDGNAHTNLLQAQLLMEYRRQSFNVTYIFRDKRIAYTCGDLSEALHPQHRALVQIKSHLWEKSWTKFWEFGMSSNLIGRQRLPQNGSGMSTYAPAYTLFNLHAAKQLGKWTFNAAAFNILDYRMNNPVAGAEQPFETGFDASQQWGPVAGRLFSLGVNWRISK